MGPPFSFETTYLRWLVLLIPPLLPEGLGPGGTLFNGRFFSKNTIKSAANIILSDENNENTHKTYLGAIIVRGEKGVRFSGRR